MTRALDVAEKLAGTPAARTPKRALPLLRPPGALDEPAFASTCTACAGCTLCLDACPAQCIRIDSAADPAARADGRQLPYIVARRSPCVICDELACMNACPAGALRLVERTQIAMGFAAIQFARCLRDEQQGGEDCRLCVTQCPIGETAIGIDERGCVEVRQGCTGCGVCERACPTEPASITVIPRA